MGRIIAIANQKGGVGKSTTTINLSACLAEKGKRVLAIDLDPQGNTTSGFGIDKLKVKDTVYQLLIGVSRLDECIQKNILPNLSLISSNFDLAGAEIELIMESLQEHQIELENIFYKLREHMEKIKNEYDNQVIPNFSLILSNFDLAGEEIKIIMRSIQEHQMQLDKIFVKLREHIERIKEEYDFIIIDCPPSLGILTGNAMATADTVLVPIQCEYYALEGLSQVIDTTNRIKKWLNPKLEIEGVVFTMFDSRTNLSLQVVENVKDNLEYNIYKTIIPKNVRLAEAPSHGLPINLYDSKSAGAEGYRNLADEVIERGEDKEWL